MPSEHEPMTIGERARMIRKRRGLGINVAAGLIGISKGYLSKLETGKKPFDSNELIGMVARGIGCSVNDLTGANETNWDPETAAAMATLPPLALAVHDSTLDDVPTDAAPRPVAELVAAVRAANAYRDQTDYVQAGKGLGQLLTELQIVNATGSELEQRKALAAIAEWGIVAYELSKNLGNPELALAAATRGLEAATRLDDPALIAFARWYRSLALTRLGADRRARTVVGEAIDRLDPAVRTVGPETLSMEVSGLLHLTSSLNAARDGNEVLAAEHADEAQAYAARVGERNSLLMHFGPTNVQAWRLSIDVGLGKGVAAYERSQRAGVDIAVLGSKNRSGGWYFDQSRALSQAGGPRDWEAITLLDKADRVAPNRTRHDPVARDLVLTLERRTARKSWEIRSLRNRFGLS